jgi:hypothetical protein
MASRGGRGKTNPETSAVVALQNIKLRAIEIERRLDEADVRAEFEELKHELGIS